MSIVWMWRNCTPKATTCRISQSRAMRRSTAAHGFLDVVNSKHASQPCEYQKPLLKIYIRSEIGNSEIDTCRESTDKVWCCYFRH